MVQVQRSCRAPGNWCAVRREFLAGFGQPEANIAHGLMQVASQKFSPAKSTVVDATVVADKSRAPPLKQPLLLLCGLLCDETVLGRYPERLQDIAEARVSVAPAASPRFFHGRICCRPPPGTLALAGTHGVCRSRSVVVRTASRVSWSRLLNTGCIAPCATANCKAAAACCAWPMIRECRPWPPNGCRP